MLSSQVILPVRVVVFASEQLFPALQFLLHTADQCRQALHSIHIYCTKDERRSGAPARRLKSVLLGWAQSHGLGFSVEITEGEMWPAAVRDGLLDWFETHPDSRWLVNVTGGTKPMSAAAMELTLSTDLKSRRVIYQEINGQWAELVHDAQGFLTVDQLQVARDSAVPPPDTLDRLLDVENLVATQFSEEHHITTQSIRPFAVDEATRQVLAKHWKWRDMAQAMGVASVGAGDAFERYIGAGLAAGGVHMKHSLKIWDGGAQGKVVREVDLVGCHRGRLVCIDIKLPGAQAHLKGTQLADVAELAHSLGGRGALAIAVRPGWPEDDGTRRLANALGVKLLTQAQAACLFSTLLAWIDPDRTPSAELVRAEALLQSHQAKGNDVLSDGAIVQVVVPDSGILSLPNVVERMVELRQQCWVLVQLLDTTQYLLVISKRSKHALASETWPTVIRELYVKLTKLVDEGANGDQQLTETKVWFYGQLTVKTGVSVAKLQDTIRSVLKPSL